MVGYNLKKHLRILESGRAYNENELGHLGVTGH